LGGAGLPLSLVDGDLGEIVRAVVEETQRARPDCEIRSELSGKLTGRWDKDRMGQLVSNLTANACQHGLAGEPIVVRAFAQEDDTVRIEVANRGIIPAERQAQLFEPLAGERKKSRSGGLGLGLFISKEIAVAHGGTIRAVSDTEAGTTTFVVELPREAAASHAFSVPPPASPASGTRTPSA
jgi:signal transduction histidine kinase